MSPPIKVLAADDDAAIRQMFADALSPLCEVILAADGQEAKELIMQDPPDVAFLDIYMPKLDGLSLTQWARELFPTMAIITMTGYDSNKAMVNSIRAGADNYLVKPFGAVQVRELVEEGKLRARMRRDVVIREAEFKRSREFAERLVDEAGAIILTLDSHGNTTTCNKTAEETSGYPREEILRRGWEELVYPDPSQRSSAHSALLEHLSGKSAGQFETEITTIRGDKRTILWLVSSVDDEHSIVVGVDLTNQRLMHQHLEIQARTDALTQLYNRLFFDEVLAREMSRSKRYGIPVSVMMIDLDGLKEVNDQHGHEAGDKVIKAAAELLRESVRKPDIVARYGGDEFIVLLPHTDEAGAAEIRRRIADASRKLAVNVGKKTIAVRLSVGTATARGEECDRLLSTADMKMYKAKKAKSPGTARRHAPPKVAEL